MVFTRQEKISMNEKKSTRKFNRVAVHPAACAVFAGDAIPRAVFVFAFFDVEAVIYR